MRSICLFLLLVLFANPLLSVTEATVQVKPKPIYKEVLKDTSKVISAALKSGAGLGLLLAGTAAFGFAIAATIDQCNGFKAIDTTILMNFVKNNSNPEKPDVTKISFNAWPLICTGLAVIGTSSYALAFLSFSSAKSDLQSINDPIE